MLVKTSQRIKQHMHLTVLNITHAFAWSALIQSIFMFLITDMVDYFWFVVAALSFWLSHNTFFLDVAEGCVRCYLYSSELSVSLSAGTFKLVIEFSEEYPNKPPTVRFISKMFHPNGEPLTVEFWDNERVRCFWLMIFSCMLVYADGSICLDILQNRWSPTYDVSSILTSIQVHDGFVIIRFMNVTWILYISSILSLLISLYFSKFKNITIFALLGQSGTRW